MSTHAFDPDCADCRPVLVDPSTGVPMSPTSPEMMAVYSVWKSTPREGQEAFHRVTVKNSRDPADLALMKALTDRIERVLGVIVSTKHN